VNPPKMPIHIGDYKRDTGHLRAAGHGAYLLLLFHHWSTGSLPDDDEQLSAIACMSKPEWKKIKPVIEKFFQPGWIHGRVLTDLVDAKESYEKLASAGSKGGKARAENKRRLSNATSDATSDAKATLNQPLTFDQVDKIGSAGASAFTPGSKDLADALWKALRFGSPTEIPPEFAGADWRAIEWERAGWTVDLIAAVARRVGPDKPLSYHEKAFASEFAKRQAPLPIVEVKPAEKITVTHAKPNGITQAIKNLNRTIAGFDGPSGEIDELCGAEGGTAPRLLSHG
jgi:uncharacterized protein YdaU (DUF1376 family)